MLHHCHVAYVAPFIIIMLHHSSSLCCTHHDALHHHYAAPFMLHDVVPFMLHFHQYYHGTALPTCYGLQSSKAASYQVLKWQQYPHTSNIDTVAPNLPMP